MMTGLVSIDSPAVARPHQEVSVLWFVVQAVYIKTTLYIVCVTSTHTELYVLKALLTNIYIVDLHVCQEC